MKVEKATPEFKPVTITLESRAEVISMRAILAAAARGRTIGETMRLWGRTEDDGDPQPHDAEIFCNELNRDFADDRLDQ